MRFRRSPKVRGLFRAENQIATGTVFGGEGQVLGRRIVVGKDLIHIA